MILHTNHLETCTLETLAFHRYLVTGFWTQFHSGKLEKSESETYCCRPAFSCFSKILHAINPCGNDFFGYSSPSDYTFSRFLAP